MKKITSTIESTTNSETSSEVLFLKATLYGTCDLDENKKNGRREKKLNQLNGTRNDSLICLMLP